MDLSIVIPCCNEADNIPRLASTLLPVAADLARNRAVEVVFVDDGSVDETWLGLKTAFSPDRLPVGVTCRFERHPVNRGLGAAIRTGLGAAAGHVIVTTDADGTYRFENIPAMLDLLRPDVDIVTGSPYHPKGGVEGVPVWRLVLSQGASALYRLVVAWRIHTWTALFRAYRRHVVETIAFESDGFLAGTELMVKALLAGYKVVEFPAVLHARMAGASKAKIWRTIRAHLGFQWRVVLHRIGMRRLVEASAPRFDAAHTQFDSRKA